jgi:pimeloyl-ACP methyl ester carboxylesterase
LDRRRLSQTRGEPLACASNSAMTPGWFDDAWALQMHWGFELSEVSFPVQVWCGELDRNIPFKSSQRMAAELNLESLQTIPGTGHLGWIAHEERILRALLD